MIDAAACHLALRSRALGVTVATTGSTALAATTTGFTRDTGSFIDDGFAVGMDVTTSGFTQSANTGHGVVTGVSASTLTVLPYVLAVSGGTQTVTRPATVTESAASGRTITAALPTMRAWENVAPAGLTTFMPVPTIPYVTESFTPATGQLLGQRHGGAVYETGLYALQWAVPAGIGITALRRSADALRRLFAPGTTLPIGSTGDVVRVRSDLVPLAGSVVDQPNGFAVLETKVYWSAESTNAIAA